MTDMLYCCPFLYRVVFCAWMFLFLFILVQKLCDGIFHAGVNVEISNSVMFKVSDAFFDIFSHIKVFYEIF